MELDERASAPIPRKFCKGRVWQRAAVTRPAEEIMIRKMTTCSKWRCCTSKSSRRRHGTLPTPQSTRSARIASESAICFATTEGLRLLLRSSRRSVESIRNSSSLPAKLGAGGHQA